MNLNDPKHPWARLTAAARQVQDERDSAAPYGFATRVAALGFAPAHVPALASLLEKFSLRAVGVAGLLAAFSLAMNYNELASRPAAPGDVEGLMSDDAIALMVDLDFSAD